MLRFKYACSCVRVWQHDGYSIPLSATEGVPPYNGPTNHSIILPLEQEERVLPIPVGKLLCVNIIIK